MRRPALIFALPLLPIFAATLEVACSSDDSGTTHGVVIGDDSGVTDGSLAHPGDGAVIDQDGSTDADGSAILPDGGGTCTTGTLAIVGGGDTSSFAASATGNGVFTTSNFATSAMAALPSVISFGTGFQAVFHAAGSNQLLSTGFTSSWSAPAIISGTLVREMPVLAVEGSTLHLVYQANDDAGADEFKYFHGTYASSWTAGDPVGAGTGQSSGPHAIGAAGLASELVTGQVGGDKNIYARSFTTAWQAADFVDGGGTGSDDGTLGTAARVIAMTGGTSEAMIVYTRDVDYKLMSLARTGGIWAVPATLSNTNAFTTEPFQLAPLPGGKAVVAWRGGDTHGYISIFDGTHWSAPFAVAPFAIASAPAVAAGNCGSEIIATYAKSAGTVETVRTDGVTLQTPAVVPGATNAKYVAIAVSP
ncbi:MAG: hypothetical protein ABI461_02905 [Polyangiaceae bacterium]